MSCPRVIPLSLLVMLAACLRTVDPVAAPAAVTLSSATPASPAAPLPPCLDVAGCEPRCRTGETDACLRGAEAALCIGEPEDRKRAGALLDVACGRGSVAACRDLAQLLGDGRVEIAGRDPERLLETACAARDGAACDGLVYRDREATDQPVARHRSLLDGLCAAGFLDGCMALEALLSADDPVNGGPRDPRGAEAARQAALRLASPRCAAGDEQACEDGATALLHMASHAPELRERARQGRLRGLALRERRCDAGAPAACEAVASALEDGQLVPRDKPRAHALHVRACEGGVAEACKNASIDYQMGHDVAVDRARAAALLERACELCDADACDSVALAAKGAGRPFVDPRKKRRGDAPIR